MSKITKITNFLIESQRVYNKDTSYPEEGAILYQGFLYNFIMSHKLEEGYSYYVYDHDNVPRTLYFQNRRFRFQETSNVMGKKGITWVVFINW